MVSIRYSEALGGNLCGGDSLFWWGGWMSCFLFFPFLWLEEAILLLGHLCLPFDVM